MQQAEKDAAANTNIRFANLLGITIIFGLNLKIYVVCEEQGLWPDCVGVQSDLSHRCSQICYVKQSLTQLS